MFRWPAKVVAADRPELCSSIDIAPTILAAAGVDIPERLPGLNLLPHLKNNTAITRKAIYGESFAHDIADIEKPEASLLYRWVIQDHHKLVLTYDGRLGRMRYPPTDSQPQLYDLESDPHETTNLASANRTTKGDIVAMTAAMGIQRAYLYKRFRKLKIDVRKLRDEL